MPTPIQIQIQVQLAILQFVQTERGVASLSEVNVLVNNITQDERRVQKQAKEDNASSTHSRADAKDLGGYTDDNGELIEVREEFDWEHEARRHRQLVRLRGEVCNCLMCNRDPGNADDSA